jgi:GrpB-like predicted nucleotidyltransferase (UPF0157 family)
MALTMAEQATDTIILAPYDHGWPALFQEERKRLQAAIGAWVVDIQHVGSTSIPGIAAKPIIDIAVHLGSLADALYCITPLVELGYECLGEFGIPGRIYFRKLTDNPLPGQAHGGAGRTHQIHMYETGHDQYEKQIIFRDYLRAHPEAAQEYEGLKRELAARYSNIEGYAEAKSDFVARILGLARASDAVPGTEEKAAAATSPSSHAAERGSPDKQ